MELYLEHFYVNYKKDMGTYAQKHTTQRLVVKCVCGRRGSEGVVWLQKGNTDCSWLSHHRVRGCISEPSKPSSLERTMQWCITFRHSRSPPLSPLTCTWAHFSSSIIYTTNSSVIIVIWLLLSYDTYKSHFYVLIATTLLDDRFPILVVIIKT